MPELLREKKPFLKRMLGKIRTEDGNFYSDETVPLISIKEFKKLLYYIDLIQISGNGEYDSQEEITSFSIQIEKVRDISQKAKDFLKISEENNNITFSLHHYEGIQSWIAIQNDERRIQYIFDVEEASCIGYLQIFKNGGWTESQEAIHPLPDIEKVLKAGQESMP